MRNDGSNASFVAVDVVVAVLNTVFGVIVFSAGDALDVAWCPLPIAKVDHVGSIFDALVEYLVIVFDIFGVFVDAAIGVPNTSKARW